MESTEPVARPDGGHPRHWNRGRVSHPHLWLARRNDLTRLLGDTRCRIFISLKAANAKARWLTGGADGMPDFDVVGRCSACFTCDFHGANRIFLHTLIDADASSTSSWREFAASPVTGSLCVGIRENVRRMNAIGAPVNRASCHGLHAYRVPSQVSPERFLRRPTGLRQLDMLRL